MDSSDPPARPNEGEDAATPAGEPAVGTAPGELAGASEMTPELAARSAESGPETGGSGGAMASVAGAETASVVLADASGAGAETASAAIENAGVAGAEMASAALVVTNCFEPASGAETSAAGPVLQTSPVAEATDPGVSYAPSGWLLGVVAFVVAAADLGTKEWAVRTIAGPELKRTGKHIEVIKDHLDFIFAQNPGGAWSFLRSMPDGLRRPFFLFVSAAAIVFIVTVYRRLERRQWAMRWGLPLALGGAIGNLADRMRYGWVVDFIDVYWKRGGDEFHWPTFNVADIAIVAGVGLMALDLLSLRRANKPAADEPAAQIAGGAL